MQPFSVSALCSGVATVALQYLMDTTDTIDGSGLPGPRHFDLLRVVRSRTVG